MHKNPFRQKQQTGNNWKHKNQRAQGEHTAKEKEWGKVKFNPVIKLQAESATPWTKFKSELEQKELEEKNANTIDINSEEAKQFLKKREENFRITRMVEKQKEATVWEDFDDEKTQDHQQRNKKKQKEITASNNSTNKWTHKGQADKNDHIKSNKSRGGKRKAYDETSSERPVNAKKPLLSDTQMTNFYSKQLNFSKTNLLRKVITKNVNLVRGMSLKAVVDDLRRRGVKRKNVGNNK